MTNIAGTTKVNLKHLTFEQYENLVSVFKEGRDWLSFASEYFEAILAGSVFTTGKWPKKYAFVKLVHQYTRYDTWKTFYDFKLYRQIREDIIKQAHDDWTKYAKAMQMYKRSPDKFIGKPRSPRKYRNRYPVIQVTKNNLIFDLDTNTVTVKLNKNFRLKLQVPDNIDINAMKSVSLGYNGFNFYALFNKMRVPQPYGFPQSNWISVDPGVGNLLSCATFDNESYLFKSSKLLGLLDSENKLVSRKKSRNGNLESKAVLKIRNKYADRVRNEVYKIAHSFIKLIESKSIGLVILGKNDSFKQNCNLGRKNNRQFGRLPIIRIYDIIEQLCKLRGIKIVYQEESYTSQSDSLVDDKLPKRNGSKQTFQGKRILRGLYSSARRLLINADINAAINIARKYLKSDAPKFAKMPVNSLTGLLNPVTVNWTNSS